MSWFSKKMVSEELNRGLFSFGWSDVDYGFTPTQLFSDQKQRNRQINRHNLTISEYGEYKSTNETPMYSTEKTGSFVCVCARARAIGNLGNK